MREGCMCDRGAMRELSMIRSMEAKRGGVLRVKRWVEGMRRKERDRRESECYGLGRVL